MKHLPLIDLSLPEAENAPRIHAALQKVGFLYINNHGIPEHLQSQLTDLAQTFFALTAEEKLKIAMEKAGLAWRGYFPVKGELTSGIPDLKEGLYFGVEQEPEHPEVQQGTPLHGPNQWPAGLPMKETVLAYMQEAKRVAEQLMRLIALGLGLEANFFADRYGAEPTELFRIFNYPAPASLPGSESVTLGVHEHTDMGFLTLLLQDGSGGLEVKPRGSEEWIAAPPVPRTFVVNIGDMLELWTHGIYQATLHRVENPAPHDRLSFPYFFDPSWHCPLERIPPQLLRPLELEQVPPATTRKWDGTNLNNLNEDTTYGEFVWNKVRKVFPEL